MSKHQFELIEQDDELQDIESLQRSNPIYISNSESHKLPSGTWILRDRLSGRRQETF